MKSKFFFSAIVVGILLSCNSSLKPEDSAQIFDWSKIKIVNHTPNHYIKKELIITTLKDIKRITDQLKLLKPIAHVNLKSSKGLFEVILSKKDNEVNTFEVVYTTYDGVIIVNEDNNKTYKNDQLEQIVMELFQ
jgi:hypothetical protein